MTGLVTRPRAVAITGLGAITPLGRDVDALEEGLLSGRSGVRLLDEPEFAELPARLAATVDLTDRLDRVEARKLDRVQQVALVAAREAWADAAIGEMDGDRLAVVLGSGIGGALTLLSQEKVLREKGPRAVSPHLVPMLMPNGPAATVGLEIGARAGVHCPVSACASGAEALAVALDLLRSGRADVVVAGGAEACVHPLPLAGFAQMRALSTRHDEPEAASRPYDKGRDGFVLGEGAGVLVLETVEHARARGARVHGHLAGAGLASDAHHVTAPDPSGTGEAGVDPRAAGGGVLLGLEHQDPGALAEDEAVAALVVGAAGLLGRVVLGGQGAHLREPGHGQRVHARLGAARDDDVRPAGPQQLQGDGEGLGTGGAGADGAVHSPAGAELQPDGGGRSVRHEHRDQVRADPARALLA
ncbi:MAG: 3-oxoacyl-(acyl-carrier-protein) synthase 2, partial [Frankiales bacterium]|nr:3-oxoacyl-(acyl-carrier-protein) synthase 2 [Frankiales bacterium]